MVIDIDFLILLEIWSFLEKCICGKLLGNKREKLLIDATTWMNLKNNNEKKNPDTAVYKKYDFIYMKF